MTTNKINDNQMTDESTTTETELANTAVDSGASRTGINDVGGLFASTTVEGALQEIGSIKAPGFENVGFDLTSGLFKITQAAGTTPTSDAPCKFYMHHTTNTGDIVAVGLTSNKEFQDATGTSDISGEEFHTIASQAYAADMLFNVYAVNGDNTNSGVEIAISMNWNATVSPVAGRIGYHDNPATLQSQEAFFFLTATNVTTSHASKPCIKLGTFRMQKNASDDWTIQSISTSDGVGRWQYGQSFDFPTQQGGASASTHFLPNTGTAAVFSSNTYKWRPLEGGKIEIEVSLSGDGGTDGSGSVDALLSVPFVTSIASNFTKSSFYIEFSSSDFIATVEAVTAQQYVKFRRPSLISISGSIALTATTEIVVHANFNNGNRTVNGSAEFNVFDNS